MSEATHEADYRATVTSNETLGFLPGTRIELARRHDVRPTPEHFVFDFDGTLSLIREGWPEVMVPMMVEFLQETGTTETAQELFDLVHTFVMELNGKQTIYQMIRLAEEISRRGVSPLEPVDYKNLYHQRLMDRITERREALRSGKTPPEDMLVPHSFGLLQALQQRGAELYLASGTDEQYVREEVELLGLDTYFGPHVYGAVDDFKTFSKAMVIRRILDENRVDGTRLVGFGDGYVEIMNVKEAGGTAVAVASDEAGRSGNPDPWKRQRLLGVGADLVIPDYQDTPALVEFLWNEREYAAL
ncbi:MAG: HAD hydrolase-like protein [Planctomycetaceae bacterium]|nr:HAD hydrolase-like protein [Planctomycetaceae bacterium]